MKALLVTLLLATASVHALAKTDPQQPVKPATHCCITDIGNWYADDEAKTRKRFEIYKSIGVDTVRLELSWRNVEYAQDKWNSDDVTRYLKLAKKYGFRIKLIVGVMMAPPKWYFDAHPEAMLTDQNGGHSYNTMSYWYPQVRTLIDKRTGQLCAILKKIGVWDSVDYVIPSFGPAGEPVYPALWTLGPGFPTQTFWCYDDAAQANFRSSMRRKYTSVEAANKAWDTTFASWADVTVLKPGAKPGQYWRDVLTWYRDSKREFIKWQIENTKKHFGNSRKILLYVPGTGYGPSDFEEAVRTGEGNDLIKLMTDSQYMIDIAATTGCWLQYTGSDNAPEVERLRRYLDERKYTGIEMWGENAGEWGSARDPVALADTVVKNRLYGLDYTHTRFVFEADAVTPGPLMPELAKAFAMVKTYWTGRK